MSKPETPSGYNRNIPSQVAVGDPTKASWANYIKTNQQYDDESVTRLCISASSDINGATGYQRTGGGSIYIQKAMVTGESGSDYAHVVLHDPSTDEVGPPENGPNGQKGWLYRVIIPSFFCVKFRFSNLSVPDTLASLRSHMPGGSSATAMNELPVWSWPDDPATYYAGDTSKLYAFVPNASYLQTFATAFNRHQQPWYSGEGGQDDYSFDFRVDVANLLIENPDGEDYNCIYYCTFKIYVDDTTGALKLWWKHSYAEDPLAGQVELSDSCGAIFMKMDYSPIIQP